MGRNPCCSKEGMNKGAWTALEDKILTDYIKKNGEGKWRNTPKQAGLKRCGKSCRLRWLNYLRPDIKRGNISLDEEDLIIRLHKLLGNRWSLIAGRLPGRTDNEIKNYWNTNLAKKAQRRILDESHNEKNEKIPMTKPLDDDGGFLVKSSKCTDFVVTTPHQDMPKFFDTKRAKMAPSMDCSTVKNMGMESESSEDSSLLEFRNESFFPDFNLDFDMGEICLSEILGSDFTHDFNNNVTQNDGTNNNDQYGNSEPPTLFSHHQAILVSEKLVENRRGIDHVHADEDSDFRALASFFESAEEWLGNDNLRLGNDSLSLFYP